jgi:signal transduction histidine kinase/DNA-binding response OmpR family regulator
MIPQSQNNSFLFWQWDLQDNEFHLSESLAQLLETKTVLKKEELFHFLDNSSRLLLNDLAKQPLSAHSESFSYQLKGNFLSLRHKFYKINQQILALCTNIQETAKYEEALNEAQSALDRSNHLLFVLQEAQSNILLGEDIRQSFDKLLSYLLEVTESEYGFMSEVLYKDGQPYLKTHAITNIAWNKETRDFYKKHAPEGMEFYNLDTLFGHVVKYDKVVIANEPYTDSRRGGLPKGHPNLNKFLGLPVHHQNKIIGMVGIANRKEGYNQDLVDFLDPFLVTYGTLIQNLRLRKQQTAYKEELILAKEMMEQALNAKTRFFTNVSHELRTPLSLIIGPLSSLLQQQLSDIPENQLRESLEKVLKNSKRLLELVEEILDLSRLNANILELHEQPTNLYIFIKELFNAFKEQASQKRLNYQFSYLADKSVICLIDQSKLDKIINNLISNAIKFTPPNGLVNLTLKIIQDKIKIEVRDTGLGIHQDQLKTIFELYHQLEQDADSEINTGLGIGLALAKELTDLMAGELQVSSSYGMGSSFLLTIPLKFVGKNTKIQPPLIEKEKAELSQKEDLHILLVEDNKEMKEYIYQILIPFFKLSTVSNGQEALNLLNSTEHYFDLVITDLMMPKMNGMELLEAIRQSSSWASLPVIVLTALSEEQTKLKVISAGIDDYLMKPFIPDELLASIQHSLEKHESRKQIATEISELQHSSTDLNWLQKLRKAIMEEISNSDLTVSSLSQKLFLSERQLYREVQRITGMTPLKYIKEVRLQHARILLETKKMNSITEVAYACGFGTVPYFSQLYNKRFGRRPFSYFD